MTERPEAGIDLDHPTVNPLRRHMIGLVQEPESLPFIEQRSEVFRGEDQLLSSSYGVTGIHGDKTSHTRTKHGAQ